MVKTDPLDKYRKSKTHSWIMIFVAAILYTIGIQMFVQVAGTFSVGLGAFAQLFTMLIKGLENYFSIIYLIINIPILAFFWKNLKKQFRIKTTVFLLVQASLGALFLIPEVKETIIGAIKFTSPNTTDPEVIRNEVWPIFVLALLGGLFVGTSTAIAWKRGGSTAGSDIIVYYFSTKKKQPVGTMMLIISLGIMVFSFIVGLIFSQEHRNHWLMVLASTSAYIFVTSTIVNRIYPKYSKVKMEIHSSKSKEIIKYLDSDKYNHSFQWSKRVSGYTKKPKDVISTVMLLLEVKDIIKDLKQIDPNVWIMETKIKRVVGQFNTSKVD
ncbi:MAG: YitT family protein [Mycoplasmataceae bacterium]|nr:YitT family protein [Mycoplasmataceae bacterium]